MSTVHSSQRRRLLRLWSLPERVTSSSSCSRARTANRIGACSLWTARARPPEHPDLLRGCLRPRVRGRGVAVGPDEPRLHRGSWLHIWGAGSGRDDGRDAAGQDSRVGTATARSSSRLRSRWPCSSQEASARRSSRRPRRRSSRTPPRASRSGEFASTSASTRSRWWRRSWSCICSGSTPTWAPHTPSRAPSFPPYWPPPRHSCSSTHAR